jgi:hypothetical protein
VCFLPRCATGNASRQAWLILDRFRAMQTLIFATSGMNWLQSRMTSGVQACCCCGVPCAAAGAGANPTAKTRPKTAALAVGQDDETFLISAFFIGEPRSFGDGCAPPAEA